MTDLWLGSGLGLVLGWIFQRAGLARPHTLKEALGMRQRSLWRMLLIALGTATVCVAFLGWLAVLDVDHLEILPLNGTLVVGSLILGAAMGFTGYTPGSMLAQLGGGKPLAGLCAVAGGVAGAVCYGWIASPVEAINGWFPEIAGTLSRTTLTSPFLLSGGFLLHGAVGVILLAVGLCVGQRAPRAGGVSAGGYPHGSAACAQCGNRGGSATLPGRCLRRDGGGGLTPGGTMDPGYRTRGPASRGDGNPDGGETP